MRMWTCFLILGALVGASCTRRLTPPEGITWNSGSATFTWSGGRIKLPRGFTYQVDQGADTSEGHFTSADGTLVIQHDIGGYAGAWASPKRSSFFEESVVENARVWVARRAWPDGKGGQTTLVAVTFPDSGCANFFVASSKPQAAVVVDLIARSFRPNGRTTPSAHCH